MRCAHCLPHPARLIAGETLGWSVTLPEYPASAWALAYSLQLPGVAPIALAATGSGTSYSATAAASVTATWAPGTYQLTATVTNTGTAQEIALGRGQFTLLPSALATLGVGHAEQMLALIEAALVRRIPAGLETTNIDGQELVRIPLTQLLALRDKYRREIAANRRRGPWRTHRMGFRPEYGGEVPPGLSGNFHDR